ncbi:dethiobiotin synthase [Chlamydia pneumoniae TW-183]|uniref:ATP-dependent dethiobiotin synthetase BioD n=1 Tax=Chlamydia pneumoniae TaxID=83558 RepID=BIOD_CHLPN|nr:dethiobiotin synthase [Chlamydia pneumoniae]Q9Z6L7.1 RecName: Full=ATP-dependent dethiobiotin synthetase BioD; AltName: Full=DTB synthetase; Short=DTBS; AltName: Full=Dethiobiotin synthase [Chlamydia pneumoniae]AAD19179.1 dethiobiotin synthetase [Chlamydia pneumoniae CWL029]AAF38607.1 dethiobiotin synthase BioD, putative [Chlamydia pneumoniae AR39]AAP99011.1 dethiobiotin synthase [Chlamydia pneumoniae TW-183]ACZ32944.1 dethiobiotin synthase [Chlamydia pneumoniae LPCoLN]BAA99249.1 dethiobio
MQRIIIVGIDTGVGKTIVSAILARALNAEYWKPIQAGNLENSDSNIVHELSGAYCHPEAYRLHKPLSPHKAAQIDNVSIEESHICAPKTTSNLIIETSGGFLSPCTSKRLQGDVFSSWSCSWILVSQAYLGSINHTCLTVEAMRSRNLNILGMVVNGYPEDEEHWLTQEIKLPIIGTLAKEKEITKTIISCYAEQWKEVWTSNHQGIQGVSGTPSLNLH